MIPIIYDSGPKQKWGRICDVPNTIDRLGKLLATTVILLITACANPTVDHGTPAQQVSGPVSTTPLLPTPDILDSPIAGLFILAPSQDSGCQLPCWQGLRVGLSDRTDVQLMFDEIVGFDGTLDVFRGNPLEDTPMALTVQSSGFPGMQVGGHRWLFNPRGHLYLTMLVDQDSGILQGIEISLTPEGAYTIYTLQDLIRILGVPSSIYIWESRSAGDPSVGQINQFLVYSEIGIVVNSVTIVRIEQVADGGSTREYAEYCLDSVREIETVYIVSQFQDDLQSLGLPGERWFGETLRDGRFFLPIEEALEMTVQEFVGMALGDDPCMIVDYTTP